MIYKHLNVKKKVRSINNKMNNIYQYNEFLSQANTQSFAIIIMTIMMLFSRNITDKYITWGISSLINLYLLFIQVLFLIKINASLGLDVDDLPWWFNYYWCIVLYTFLAFMVFYIIEIIFSDQISKITHTFMNKCDSQHHYLDINFDDCSDDMKSQKYRTIYKTKNKCLTIMTYLIKIFYVMLYLAAIVTILVICDPDKC